ncbi:hypothetical protein [Weissella diestrammenae]|nr:hypothetical protein [Weissella diestrammenae]
MKNIAIATNSYHVFRAVALARCFGFNYQGIGGRTPLYILQNASL